jgi:hypothetical protein
MVGNPSKACDLNDLAFEVMILIFFVGHLSLEKSHSVVLMEQVQVIINSVVQEKHGSASITSLSQKQLHLVFGYKICLTRAICN